MYSEQDEFYGNDGILDSSVDFVVHAFTHASVSSLLCVCVRGSHLSPRLHLRLIKQQTTAALINSPCESLWICLLQLNANMPTSTTRYVQDIWSFLTMQKYCSVSHNTAANYPLTWPQYFRLFATCIACQCPYLPHFFTTSSVKWGQRIHNNGWHELTLEWIQSANDDDSQETKWSDSEQMRAIKLNSLN